MERDDVKDVVHSVLSEIERDKPKRWWHGVGFPWAIVGILIAQAIIYNTWIVQQIHAIDTRVSVNETRNSAMVENIQQVLEYQKEMKNSVDNWTRWLTDYVISKEGKKGPPKS